MSASITISPSDPLYKAGQLGNQARPLVFEGPSCPNVKFAGMMVDTRLVGQGRRAWVKFKTVSGYKMTLAIHKVAFVERAEYDRIAGMERALRARFANKLEHAGSNKSEAWRDIARTVVREEHAAGLEITDVAVNLPV
ncbi:uncharacterized protein RHOBADRAFT_45246 [Rhodotorula graminis WP1]|uniref:Uncharacterized protein n=1 Tax=Rhodotorula graminis (strain WP1) TaxID=578459 RepID=A0A0P9EP37_RHOGW|nr:uncharacterized protein RHOBADRAFT_45246 [Rhodotorula graminis WP1]KPV73954.1 hypothetical protein RHOBADRAFT_45246 [Rhodotorula graminis WP1]